MATVPPSSKSVVGVVGRGFISVLAAKLAALRGYTTWLLVPVGQLEVVKEVLGGYSTEMLQLIESSDTDTWAPRVKESNALLFAVDAAEPLDLDVVNYLLSKEQSPQLERVVAMSRNLNNQGMGFIVKAAKAAANSEIWDGATSSQYKAFEAAIIEGCSKVDVDYTIVRAGTLKGGGSGEDGHNQYLSSKFYELVEKDIVKWQYLFDCGTRGVVLKKGDVLPGPGGKAVLTATSAEACPGDSSRCNIAEAMVRSLALEYASNVDFGIGTAARQVPLTDDEWDSLFSAL